MASQNFGDQQILFSFKTPLQSAYFAPEFFGSLRCGVVKHCLGTFNSAVGYLPVDAGPDFMDPNQICSAVHADVGYTVFTVSFFPFSLLVRAPVEGVGVSGFQGKRGIFPVMFNQYPCLDAVSVEYGDLAIYFALVYVQDEDTKYGFFGVWKAADTRVTVAARLSEMGLTVEDLCIVAGLQWSVDPLDASTDNLVVVSGWGADRSTEWFFDRGYTEGWFLMPSTVRDYSSDTLEVSGWLYSQTVMVLRDHNRINRNYYITVHDLSSSAGVGNQTIVLGGYSFDFSKGQYSDTSPQVLSAPLVGGRWYVLGYRRLFDSGAGSSIPAVVPLEVCSERDVNGVVSKLGWETEAEALSNVYDGSGSQSAYSPLCCVYWDVSGCSFKSVVRMLPRQNVSFPADADGFFTDGVLQVGHGGYNSGDVDERINNVVNEDPELKTGYHLDRFFAEEGIESDPDWHLYYNPFVDAMKQGLGPIYGAVAGFLKSADEVKEADDILWAQYEDKSVDPAVVRVLNGSYDQLYKLSTTSTRGLVFIAPGDTSWVWQWFMSLLAERYGRTADGNAFVTTGVIFFDRGSLVNSAEVDYAYSELDSGHFVADSRHMWRYQEVVVDGGLTESVFVDMGVMGKLLPASNSALGLVQGVSSTALSRDWTLDFSVLGNGRPVVRPPAALLPVFAASTDGGASQVWVRKGVVAPVWADRNSEVVGGVTGFMPGTNLDSTLGGVGKDGCMPVMRDVGGSLGVKWLPRVASYYGDNPSMATYLKPTTALVGWGLPVVPGSGVLGDYFLGADWAWHVYDFVAKYPTHHLFATYYLVEGSGGTFSAEVESVVEGSMFGHVTSAGGANGTDTVVNLNTLVGTVISGWVHAAGGYSYESNSLRAAGGGGVSVYISVKKWVASTDAAQNLSIVTAMEATATSLASVRINVGSAFYIELVGGGRAVSNTVAGARGYVQCRVLSRGSGEYMYPSLLYNLGQLFVLKGQVFFKFGCWEGYIVPYFAGGGDRPDMLEAPSDYEAGSNQRVCSVALRSGFGG